MSGVIGLFLFTTVPLTLSIPFKVEEKMNQLSFNGLLKPASRCMTLTMFKYCRTDAGRSRLAKEAAYIAIVFSFAGTGGTQLCAEAEERVPVGCVSSFSIVSKGFPPIARYFSLQFRLQLQSLLHLLTQKEV